MPETQTPDLNVTGDEVLDALRELAPTQLQIAQLAVANSKLTAALQESQEQLAAFAEALEEAGVTPPPTVEAIPEEPRQ